MEKRPEFLITPNKSVSLQFLPSFGDQLALLVLADMLALCLLWAIFLFKKIFFCSARDENELSRIESHVKEVANPKMLQWMDRLFASGVESFVKSRPDLFVLVDDCVYEAEQLLAPPMEQALKDFLGEQALISLSFVTCSPVAGLNRGLVRSVVAWTGLVCNENGILGDRLKRKYGGQFLRHLLATEDFSDLQVVSDNLKFKFGTSEAGAHAETGENDVDLDSDDENDVEEMEDEAAAELREKIEQAQQYMYQLLQESGGKLIIGTLGSRMSLWLPYLRRAGFETFKDFLKVSKQQQLFSSECFFCACLFC